MSKRIYLSPPHLSGNELEYLRDAIASNWIAPVGPHIEAFEKELCDKFNIAHALTTNSGTSAIHLALLALNVSQGDEVICQSLTFCATVNPVVYCGATPVFIDSEKSTWNMDPELVEEAIDDRIRKTGKKPKAIVLVHLYGMPARIEKILQIAAKHNIPVVEDAAEAVGSTYNGRPLGSFGSASIFSFNGNKIVTSSAGGALISNDHALIEQARYFRQDAKEPLPYYEHRAIGYNYRMSNVLAALGRSQFHLLDERVKKRRAIFGFYRSAFNDMPNLEFQPEANGSRSNRWLTAITFENYDIREKVRHALAAESIESRIVWKPMHAQPVFQDYAKYGGSVSENLFNTGLCLPSGSALTDDELHQIAEIVRTNVNMK